MDGSSERENMSTQSSKSDFNQAANGGPPHGPTSEVSSHSSAGDRKPPSAPVMALKPDGVLSDHALQASGGTQSQEHQTSGPEANQNADVSKEFNSQANIEAQNQARYDALQADLAKQNAKQNIENGRSNDVQLKKDFNERAK
jgi:hypothetical protein